MAELRDVCRGRWPFIHEASGISPEALRQRHGPCPGCGGRDRFIYYDKDGYGTFFCRGGGDFQGGDGFALLEHVHGWSFRQSAEFVRDLLNLENDWKPELHSRPMFTREEIEYMALWCLTYSDNKNKGYTPSVDETQKFQRYRGVLDRATA